MIVWTLEMKKPLPTPREVYRDLKDNRNMQEYIDYMASHGVWISTSCQPSGLYRVEAFNSEIRQRSWVDHEDELFAMAGMYVSWLSSIAARSYTNRRRERA